MYDDWKASGPHEHLPSVEQGTCACGEPWAWRTDEGEPLCETHATEYHLRAAPAAEAAE